MSGPPHHRGPVRAPIARSRARIAFGAATALLALAVLIGVLPKLPDEIDVVGLVAAGVLALAAAALIVSGALYRPQVEVVCRRCARPVVAWKVAFGAQCPLAPHHARVSWLLVTVTALFWSSFLLGGIGAAIWLL